MRNIGTYRMQVFDGRTTGMHWQRHKGGAQHHRVAERLGKRLEVAVALSPEPVLTYCATAPMPEGLDELLLGGFLARRRIEMVKCVTVDLEVPASAHIVLEGYVEPGERRREGPFGDHTGLLLAARRLSGLPPDLRHAAQAADLSDDDRRHSADGGLLPRHGERADLPADDPQDACRRSSTCTFRPKASSTTSSSSRSTSAIPGHARKIMNAFWGLGQLMFSKTIVVVDKDVNVHDVSEVAWIVGTHMDPLRDIQMTKGPVDDLDDAADLPAYGGKMGIDATRKWASEGYTRIVAGAHPDDRAGRPEARAEIWAKLERHSSQRSRPLVGCDPSQALQRSAWPSQQRPTPSFSGSSVRRRSTRPIYEEVEADPTARRRRRSSSCVLSSLAAGIGARGLRGPSSVAEHRLLQRRRADGLGGAGRWSPSRSARGCCRSRRRASMSASCCGRSASPRRRAAARLRRPAGVTAPVFVVTSDLDARRDGRRRPSGARLPEHRRARSPSACSAGLLVARRRGRSWPRCSGRRCRDAGSRMDSEPGTRDGRHR